MKKAYVVIDEEMELIGVGTNLKAVKQIVKNLFLENDLLEEIKEICIYETIEGREYEIDVLLDGLTYSYNAYCVPLTGGSENERI